jgi:hypothetical protein
MPEVELDLRDNAPLIAAGGGLLLFISLFLNWLSAGELSLSAWEYFDLVDIALALIAVIVVAIGVMLFTGNTGNLPAAPGPIVRTASLIALAIVAAFVLDPIDFSGEGVDIEFGAWLALIATIVMLVGGTQLRDAPAAPRTRAQEPPAPPPPPPPPPPPANPAV